MEVWSPNDSCFSHRCWIVVILHSRFQKITKIIPCSESKKWMARKDISAAIRFLTCFSKVPQSPTASSQKKIDGVQIRVWQCDKHLWLNAQTFCAERLHLVRFPSNSTHFLMQKEKTGKFILVDIFLHCNPQHFSGKAIQRSFLGANVQTDKAFGKHFWRIAALRFAVIYYKFNKLLRVKFFRLPDTWGSVSEYIFVQMIIYDSQMDKKERSVTHIWNLGALTLGRNGGFVLEGRGASLSVCNTDAVDFTNFATTCFIAIQCKLFAAELFYCQLHVAQRKAVPLLIFTMPYFYIASSHLCLFTDNMCYSVYKCTVEM